MLTWSKLIGAEMEKYGESFADVVASTLTNDALEKDFAVSGGEPFTVWTKSRVYFPVVYDCFTSCGSVSRDPDGQPTAYVGGG
jgi:hypothetical protein